MFTLQHLSKTFRAGEIETTALDRIDLDIEAGEYLAITGPSGCGKSTLLGILGLLDAPSSGEYWFDGHNVAGWSERQLNTLRRGRIGFVFQSFNLIDDLSVADNIALALEGRFDLKALAVRVTEVSARYGLPLDPHRLVHSLSVGERQRVEIVRCLLQNPQLLILDEPTSVLTPQAVRRLFGTLRQLASEGVSILYISHKLHEIQELCDRATVMRGGRVTGEAIPAQETSASLARMMIGRDLPVCVSPPFAGEGLAIAGVSGLG